MRQLQQLRLMATARQPEWLPEEQKPPSCESARGVCNGGRRHLDVGWHPTVKTPVTRRKLVPNLTCTSSNPFDAEPETLEHKDVEQSAAFHTYRVNSSREIMAVTVVTVFFHT